MEAACEAVGEMLTCRSSFDYVYGSPVFETATATLGRRETNIFQTCGPDKPETLRPDIMNEIHSMHDERGDTRRVCSRTTARF